MATYKVIQDIEADDKLIGWMTPRQAVYAAIVIVSGGIGFMLTASGAWWLAIFLLPHMILFTVLSGPFVHDQPSEVWLLAKIQFALKPRRRIWDQSGLSDLVTITVPKKIERILTDGLSQTEVKSRLKALASTLDSRGWAVKNVNANLFAQPQYGAVSGDRLIEVSTMPQEVPDDDIPTSADILDEQSNPTAQSLERMIDQSAASHREQLMQMMQQGSRTTSANQQQAAGGPNWFAGAIQPTTEVQVNQNEMQPELPLRQNRPNPAANMRRISPEGPSPAKATQAEVATPKSVDPVVQELSQKNDWTVATVSRQANKLKEGDDEVVISLH